METVEVVFSTTNSPFSWLVRGITWSKYSHCGILNGATVIESHALHGVREVSLKEYLKNNTKYEIVELPCHDAAAAIKAAQSQIGKKYDWLALFGILFQRKEWESKNRWFCSELVAWAVEQAGKSWFREDMSSRIHPQHIWMLRPEKVLVKE